MRNWRSRGHHRYLRDRQSALIDDMVSAVHVERFSGDEPRGVMGQERGGKADVVDAHQTAGGSLALRLLQKLVEFRNPRSGASSEWSRRDGVDADALRAELGRHVAHGAF